MLFDSALLKWIPVPFVAGGIASLAALARYYLFMMPPTPPGPALSLTAKAILDPRALVPVAIATIASTCLYYVFIFAQGGGSLLAHELVSTKARKDGEQPTIASVKYGAAAFPYVRTLDRSVGNFMEQWPPLLIAMWLYALFVDAPRAGALGMCWVLTRSYYPFVHYAAFSNDILEIIFASTLPGYLLIFYMLGQVAASIMV